MKSCKEVENIEELLLRFARRLVIVGSIMVFLGILALLTS